jgi:cysteinyl-tRNA synthetase
MQQRSLPIVGTALAENMLISELLTPRAARAHMSPLLSASALLHLAVAMSAGPALAAPRMGIETVRSWGYQLQQVDPAAIAATPYDLVVIDYARDGTAAGAFEPTRVAQMQRKPDGQRRIVLAYLSIGEAEDYRFYWQRDWSVTPPDWLGAENPDWPGNYAVNYWDEAWQALILGAPGAYLDAIIASGFDGVYLDRIDAFDVPAPGVSRAQRMQLMSDFVVRIASYARQYRPGFIVVGQNGEELLDEPNYASTIDAVAKEDLFFGLAGDGKTNSNAELRASLRPLVRFQTTGKPVLLVEYLDTPQSIALARQKAAALGAPLFIGDRELDDVDTR